MEMDLTFRCHGLGLFACGSTRGDFGCHVLEAAKEMDKRVVKAPRSCQHISKEHESFTSFVSGRVIAALFVMQRP